MYSIVMNKYTFSNLTLSSLVVLCNKLLSYINNTHIHLCVHFPCAQDGSFPLHAASQEGYIGIMDVLIKVGAKVDLQTKVGFAAH